MKTSRHNSLRLARVLAALGVLTASVPCVLANFTPTIGGTYDYNDTANWSGSTINNTWGSTLTGDQTLTFGADTTLSSSLGLNNVGTPTLTFIGAGGNRTLTLGGTLGAGSNSGKVTFGSITDGQKLNIDLGGASRTFSTSTNRTIEILNTLSGTGSITKQGAGTLQLTGTANSYTGGTNIGASGQTSGILEVTKLANGGTNSSIGNSANTADKLVFGGTTAGGGTLRYVGSGDSTDRRFTVGGVGAVFDASGTGALNWTNTSSPTYASVGNARTITLKGTSTHNNTMSASFTDSGVGKTSLTKDGTGTWILAGNNTATGDITVTAGKLAISANNRLGDTARLVMNGGTFSTAGFNETLGTLQLTAASNIDLGANVDGSNLVFSASNAETWTASIILSFINFTEGTDTIRIGTSASGLTTDQLSQIRINGLAALIDSDGYLSAVPEPSTYALLAGLLGLGFVSVRRTRARLAA